MLKRALFLPTGVALFKSFKCHARLQAPPKNVHSELPQGVTITGRNMHDFKEVRAKQKGGGFLSP
jgi:hypothetical protein